MQELKYFKKLQKYRVKFIKSMNTKLRGTYTNLSGQGMKKKVQISSQKYVVDNRGFLPYFFTLNLQLRKLIAAIIQVMIRVLRNIHQILTIIEQVQCSLYRNLKFYFPSIGFSIITFREKLDINAENLGGIQKGKNEITTSLQALFSNQGPLGCCGTRQLSCLSEIDSSS